MPLLQGAPPPYYAQSTGSYIQAAPGPQTTIMYAQPVMIPSTFGFSENPMVHIFI